MIFNSGAKYRSIPSNKEFSFSSRFNLNNTSGTSILGFSGNNNTIDFLTFKSGKILDFNNRHIWSYNPQEDIFLSGNIGENFVNYFINNNPICLYCPRETGYYNNFYVSTNNAIFEVDFTLQSEKPEFIFNFPSEIGFGSNVTGNIVNKNEDNLKSFKIFTGFLDFSNVNYIVSTLPVNNIFGGETGLIKLNFNDNFVSQGISGTSLLLNLSTNFGIVQKQIDLIYSKIPLYFIDFVTGFTGVTGFNLDQGLFYSYELQTISPENQNFTLSLINYSGHTGEQIFENFNITGDVSGIISGFVQGVDFIAGNLNGIGISEDLEVDFFNNIVSGSINFSERASVVATGDIQYNYNLLFAGGSGLGPAPLNTKITGLGNLISKENINSFIFSDRELTGIGTGFLTGFWGTIFQSSTGEGFIQENKFFTGGLLANYSHIKAFVNKLSLGSKWFENYIIFGITGNTGLNYILEDSGVKNLNINILIAKNTGIILESLIPFKTEGDFLLSGVANASVSSNFAEYLFYPTPDFWFTNSTINTGYVDFDFSQFKEEDRYPVTHYEINLDIGSNYYPYIFSIKGFDNINNPPVVLDTRTGEDFYLSPSRIFETKTTGKFNILRLEINSGIFWPHRNQNFDFPYGLKIQKLNYFNSQKFSGFFDSLSPFLLNNKSIDFTATGGNIFISSNTGNNWNPKEESLPWVDIDITYDGKIQSAVTSGGHIYVSYDSGQNWSQKTFTGDWRTIAISKLDGQYQFALTTRSGFLSTDTGNNWNIIQNLGPLSNDSFFTDSIISEDGQYLATAAYNGRVWTSVNFGQNWRNGNSPTVNWKGISMSRDGQILTAVVFSGGNFDPNAGRIFRSFDAGESWNGVTTSSVNQRRNWVAVDMSNDGQYQTAVEQTGNIFLSTNTGQNWSNISLIKDWVDIAISYSGGFQILTTDNDQIYTSENFGQAWSPKEINRPWRGVSISKDGSVQAVASNPPYIEIFSSNIFGFNVNDYQAFNTGNFAIISGFGDNFFLTYKLANPLNKNFNHYYIDFEQGYVPSRILLQQSKNGISFDNIYEKNRNINRIESGIAILSSGNQYIKWIFSPTILCDNTGDSNNILDPIIINIKDTQTKICGVLSGSLPNYYTINNNSNFIISNIGVVSSSNISTSFIFNLQSGFYFSNSSDTGQYIVSGLVNNNLLFSNLLTSLSKNTSSVFGSGMYNIQIKPTGFDFINYNLVIFSIDIDKCSVTVENAGFDFSGSNLDGSYTISNRFNSSGTWNGRKYYENQNKNKSIWWNGEKWILGGGQIEDTNPDNYSYVYSSGSGDFFAPYFINIWESLVGRPNPNIYRYCF